MRTVPTVGMTDDNVLVVPSKTVARLISAGLAAERKERKRLAKRKTEKEARRRNR